MHGSLSTQHEKNATPTGVCFVGDGVCNRLDEAWFTVQQDIHALIT